MHPRLSEPIGGEPGKHRAREPHGVEPIVQMHQGPRGVQVATRDRERNAGDPFPSQVNGRSIRGSASGLTDLEGEPSARAASTTKLTSRRSPRVPRSARYTAGPPPSLVL